MRAFPEGLSGRALSQSILLLAAILSALLMRYWFSTGILPPPPRMQGETTQAYRYASMIAEGGTVPAVDSLVMHPAGFETAENSIFEEYIAGGLHRFAFRGMPFDSYLRVFCLAFPLLGMLALYLWLSEAGLGVAKATMGAIAYGFLLPAMLRARGESFYRETVAVPFILFLCWAVEKSVRAPGSRRSIPAAAASALFLILANASWKASGFITAGILLYILAMNTGRRLPLPSVILPASAQIASALLVPHMAREGAILSPASIMAFALLVSAFVRMTSLPVLAAAASIVTVLFRFNEATAHVGAMLLAKLRFLFVHPADPLRLSADARLFWVGGYETPQVGQIILLFGPLLVFAVFGIRKMWRRGPTLLRWALLLAMAAYLMMDRLHVLLAPVLIAPALETLRKPLRYPALGLALGLQSVFVVPFAGVLESAGLRVQTGESLLTESELSDLLSWAESETEPGESFLSYWHISGFLSAYAERPVVTHTFFENPSNRRTIEEFAERMFQDEDSLIALMERVDADYVVYQADFLLDATSSGLLYLAGRTVPPLESAAWRMQYRPENLERLRLVFQGPSLRVFAVNGSSAPDCTMPPGPLFEERYSSLFGEYRKATAVVSDPLGTAMSLATAGMANRSPDLLSAALMLLSNNGGVVEDATGLLQQLLVLHMDGLYPIEPLADDFHTYLAAYGPDPEIRIDLARIYLASGMTEEASMEYSAAIAENPALEGSGVAEDLAWLGDLTEREIR